MGDELYYKAVTIENDLERIYDYDPEQLWFDLQKKFSFFSLHIGKISRLLKGKTNTGIEFNLFEFEYITGDNKHRKTHHQYGLLTDLKGFNMLINLSKKHRYRRINPYDNDKYVSFIDGPEIEVEDRHKEKWQSHSKMFNQLFKIRCASPTEANRFFTSDTVSVFEERFSTLKTLDVHESGQACIEFKGEILPKSVKAPKLKNTQEYLEKLANPSQLPDLEAAKELIDFIQENKRM